MDVQAKSAPFAVILAALALVLLPTRGAAQLVFDWPVRADVGPEALLTGAAAALWNPGGISVAPGSEAWIVSVDGPETTEVGGVAGAVALEMPWLGRLGMAFRHLGIEDIPRTLDSPAPEPGEIDVAEDAVVLGLSRPLRSWLSVGLGGRWVRGSVLGDARTRTTVDAGVHVSPALPFRPALGLALLDLGGDERVLGALSASLPTTWTRPFDLALGYGVNSSARTETVEQRVSLRVSWRARLRAGAGLTFPDDGDGGVNPLWMAGAEFGRYSLSVLREQLSNDFGAVHYYRAAIRF